MSDLAISVVVPAYNEKHSILFSRDSRELSMPQADPLLLLHMSAFKFLNTELNQRIFRHIGVK